MEPFICLHPEFCIAVYVLQGRDWGGVGSLFDRLKHDGLLFALVSIGWEEMNGRASLPSEYLISGSK